MKKAIFFLVLIFGLMLALGACGETAATSTPANVTADITLSTTVGLSATTTLAATATAPTTLAPTPTLTQLSTPTVLPSPTAVPARVIVIDPGHGGIDWGAFHTNADNKIDMKEKEVTLQLSFKTAEILRADGFKVILTRTQDELANNPARDLNQNGKVDQDDDQLARILIANENKADLFFSIHLNSSELKNKVGGMETWYTAERPFGDQNKRFAQLVDQHTAAAMKAIGFETINRGARPDTEMPGPADEHIFVLGPPSRNHSEATMMPGVLTEALFVTNDNEVNVLRDPKNINLIANAYAKAVEEYFK